jgi:phosphoglycerate-specific signal transduction histidine kinase
MDNSQKSREELTEEFRNLGHNLVEALRAAWNTPERQRLQRELEAGLAEFTVAIKEEAARFEQSATSQQIKSEFEDLKQRVQSGEAETIARQEILSALRKVNDELGRASRRWKAGQDRGEDK